MPSIYKVIRGFELQKYCETKIDESSYDSLREVIQQN